MQSERSVQGTPHSAMPLQNSDEHWPSYNSSFFPNAAASTQGISDQQHAWSSMAWNHHEGLTDATHSIQQKISHPEQQPITKSRLLKQRAKPSRISLAPPSSKRQRVETRARSDEEHSDDGCPSQCGSQSSCCSSCPDSPPCEEPDCTLAVPCTDKACEVPVCTEACLGTQNLAIADHTKISANWLNPVWSQQSSGLTQKSTNLVDRNLEGCDQAQYAVASSIYSNSPSIITNDVRTSYGSNASSHTAMYQAQASYNNDLTPNTGFTNPGELGERSFGTGQMNADAFSFICRWDGCEQPSFPNQDEWLSHLHAEHLDPQFSFRCPIPEESCPTDIGFDFLGHLEDSHGFNFADTFNCPAPDCDSTETYCDPSMLHNHFDHAHATPNEGTLHCRVDACDAGFTDPNQLFYHLNRFHHVPVELPSGSEINLTLPTKASQPISLIKNDVHVESSAPVAADSADKASQHLCKWVTGSAICGQALSSEAELQTHITVQHLNSLDKSTGYNCLWQGCGRHVKRGIKSGFSQRGKLERHMATHTGFKCATCDICGKTFSAEQSMKQHRLLHTGAKPWQCKYCDRSFPQQSACTIHERTHTGDKPLSCNICGKKFSESSNLSKHRKIHGEKGMHSCGYPGCAKSFHRLDQLKRHRLVHMKAEERLTGSMRKGSGSESPLTRDGSEFGSEA